MSSFPSSSELSTPAKKNLWPLHMTDSSSKARFTPVPQPEIGFLFLSSPQILLSSQSPVWFLLPMKRLRITPAYNILVSLNP